MCNVLFKVENSPEIPRARLFMCLGTCRLMAYIWLQVHGQLGIKDTAGCVWLGFPETLILPHGLMVHIWRQNMS